MTAVLSPVPVQKFLDNNGFPLFRGTLTTYAAGTTTPQATYVDSTQTTQNTNPITLNTRGECNLWLDPTKSYKFLLKDFFGNTIWTVDNIPGGALTADLLPIPTNTVNLGGPSNTFKNLYLGPSGQPLLDTTSGNALFYARTAGEISAGVTPSFYDYPAGNVLRYGADPLGVASSYTAFLNAAAVCKGTGLVMVVPAGNYNLPTSNAPIPLSYVTLLGTGVTEGTATPAAAGSVLSFTGSTTTNSAFRVGPGVAFDGIGFLYPSQVDSATPIAFSPTLLCDTTIAGAINFVYVQNCTVFNAYRFFVDTDAAGSIGHVYLQNNTIYGILTCFELAYNAEIITITDNEFTFGHFLAATEGGLRGYTRANGSVMKVIQSDGLVIQGNVFFGYQNGLNIPISTTGGNGGLFQLTSIVDNYFDQCLFPINISGTGNWVQCSIVGNSFNALNTQDHTQIGNCIKVSTSGNVAAEVNVITGNSFSLCTGDFVNVSGNTPKRNLTFTGNAGTVWGAFQTVGTYACLNISGTATSWNASGNQWIAASGFGAALKGIIGSFSDCVITGNLFGVCAEALNISSNKAVVTGNQSYSTSGTFSNNYAFVAATTDLGNFWDKDSLQTTGWGTPVGGAVIASYNITDAGGANSNTNKALAEIIVILKAKGIIAA